MPAKLVPDSDLGAGIQEHSARASDEAAWIPGLALLARNDAAVTLQIFCNAKETTVT